MTDSQRTTTAIHPLARRRTLRAIAIFEAVKGIAALALMIGVLDLIHRDIRHLAMELIGHFGLNPDAHYPAIALQYATMLSHINPASLVLLALINSGMTPQEVPVKRGLQFLRALKMDEPKEHPETYQVALVIMALSAAKDGATSDKS